MNTATFFAASLGITSVLFTTSAKAENLIYVSTDASGSNFYYDSETIKKTGNKITVWMIQDAKNDKTVPHRTYKARMILDCQLETSTRLQYVTYSASGVMLQSETIPQHQRSEEGVIPGSIGAAFMQSLCP